MAWPLVPSRPGVISLSRMFCGGHKPPWMPAFPHLSISELAWKPAPDWPVSRMHHSPGEIKSRMRRGGSICEMNKVCQFSGRGPTPGFCLWLTLGLWGHQILLCMHPRGNPSPVGVSWGTLFTHSTLWKSVRLQIRCSETNVITLTSTSRFLPSISSRPELVAGGKVPTAPTRRLLFCFVFATYLITRFHFYQCDLKYNPQKQEGEIIMSYILVDVRLSFWNLCVFSTNYCKK